MKIENLEEAQEVIGEINRLQDTLNSISSSSVNIRFTNNNGYSYLSLYPAGDGEYKKEVHMFYSAIKKNIEKQILVLTNHLEAL